MRRGTVPAEHQWLHAGEQLRKWNEYGMFCSRVQPVHNVRKLGTKEEPLDVVTQVNHAEALYFL